MRALLRQLSAAFGPSGDERGIRAVIAELVREHVDEMHVDAFGNLIARRRGRGGKRVLLAAHMDEIGLMVTQVDDKGFARFTSVGYLPPLSLLGMRMRFADGGEGIIWADSRNLLPTELPKGPEWWLDIAGNRVQVGDTAVYAIQWAENDSRIIAQNLDDRAGCAVLIEVLRQLKETEHELIFAFTTQEEIGTGGAMVVAYACEPDVALAIDVTPTGDLPKGPYMAVELGKGAAIKVKDSGMVAHPGVKQALADAAARAHAPYQLEILVGGTTDAKAMQVTRAGVPAGALSIPCRYVHTPGEMIDHADLQACVNVLLSYLAGQTLF